jgi:hypothetical protein
MGTGWFSTTTKPASISSCSQTKAWKNPTISLIQMFSPQEDLTGEMRIGWFFNQSLYIFCSEEKELSREE